MKRHIIYVFFLFLPLLSFGQYNQYHQGDTTKVKYPYTFPIFGNFLHDAGVDLPYPVGAMVNSYYGVQNILITDVAVGFEGGPGVDIPLTDISRLIEFEDVVAKAYSVNFRPDIWILPFLDIYGIIGKVWSETDVKIVYPFEFNALAKLNGMSFGIGMTFAGGFSHYFGVFDINNVWTYMTNFEEPVKTRVMSPRFGRTFQLKKAESNFGIWIGAMSVNLGGVTSGSIKLADVLPPGTWENKDEIVNNYYEWYYSIDELKQNAADKILTPIVENIASANGDATVLYSITKESKAEWNMLIGAQYQINKHVQVRTEFGFLGERTSWLLSANYRFGIKHK